MYYYFERSRPRWGQTIPEPSAKVPDEPAQVIDCNGFLIPFFGYELRSDGTIAYRTNRLRRDYYYWEPCWERTGIVEKNEAFSFVVRFRGWPFAPVWHDYAFVRRKPGSSRVEFWTAGNEVITFEYVRERSTWEAHFPYKFVQQLHPNATLQGFQLVPLECNESGSLRKVPIFGETMTLQMASHVPCLAINQALIPTAQNASINIVVGNGLRVFSSENDATRLIVEAGEDSTYVFEVIPQRHQVGGQLCIDYWWANIVPIWSIEKHKDLTDDVAVQRQVEPVHDNSDHIVQF